MADTGCGCGNVGESGLDHFLPVSELAVVSMAITVTEPCSSSLGSDPFGLISSCQKVKSFAKGSQ